MDAPAFDAKGFAGAILPSIVLYLSIIAISMMTMVKPAQASGTLQSGTKWCILPFQNQFPICGYATPAIACDAYTGSVSTQIPVSGYPGTRYHCISATGFSPGDTFIKYSCPANSTGSGGACTCNDPYVPDSAGTSCVPVPVVACPVLPLTTPPFNDACSTSLDQGKGKDVNHACGELTSDMANAAICIATKINAALTDARSTVQYTDPSATIRTTAYQNHLLEIWDKSQRLYTIMNSAVYLPEVKQACAPRNVEVNNEKAAHGITHQPSSSGDAAPHVEHRAIDVPEAVANALMDQVTTYTTTVTTVNGQNVSTQEVASDVEDYMHSATVNPPACDSNISWGGRFDSYDYVHFQLPKNQGDTP